MKTVMEDFPDFEKRISIAVEYCTVRGCGAVVSSEGCSNPECPNTRPLHPLQEAMRALALSKHYGTTRYKPCQQQILGTRH
jgi:hypothetical protein